MYKKRIRDWRLAKYCKQSEKLVVLERVQQRERLGKDTHEIIVRGRRIPIGRIMRKPTQLATSKRSLPSYEGGSSESVHESHSDIEVSTPVTAEREGEGEPVPSGDQLHPSVELFRFRALDPEPALLLETPEVYKIPELLLRLSENFGLSNSTPVYDSNWDVLCDMRDSYMNICNFSFWKRYRAARIMTGRALDCLKQSLNGKDPSLSNILAELFCMHESTEENMILDKFWDHVLDLCNLIVGKNHPFALLMQILPRAEHRKDICELLLRRDWETCRTRHGCFDPMTKISLEILCTHLEEVGKVKEAQKLFEEELTRSQERFGTAHVMSLSILYQLAGTHAKVKEFAKSQFLLEEILRPGRNHPANSAISTLAVVALARLAMKQGLLEAAEFLLRRALYEEMTFGGLDDLGLPWAAIPLEDVLRDQGRHEEANAVRDQFLLRDESEESFADV